ncbi:MAG: OmpA family protein [Bacteroidales bacterium]|nr:OmpA family protein [Bacteroidales bacterium]
MKKLITLLIITAMGLMVFPINSEAQLLKKLEQKLEKSVEKQVDKTLNKAKEKKDTEVRDSQTNDQPVADKGNSESEVTSNPDQKKDYVSSYKSKFDFVPGERVIISDDFSQDAVGDFPALWFTNGSGEIVTIDNVEGKWLMIKGRSQAYIDQLLELPDNFTIQFDLLCSVPFTWYSDVFNIYLEDIIDLDKYRKGQNGGEMSSNNINYHFWLDLHPGKYNPGTYSTKGYGKYEIKNSGAKMELNEIWMPTSEKHMLKVSIWRQGERLRLYLNENKILDLPKIIPVDMKPNLLVFEPYDLNEDDKYFLGNLRIAVGNPDTRNKLLTDGRLVTNGILFNVNSAEIKTESYGVLKEIAGILNESKDVKVKIIGHTDSDGDEALNLELSKKRAEAVKNALSKDFSIDSRRMETDGKGETEPMEPNTSVINKANNRRVEFIKID